ncbi:glycosyltransferase family 1 protein [Megamonas hypermegale]|uniref:glycosyltransferase family 4 protein n=1 Tax=Megamonas hypermegale TaxID=158847 RepID=UPI0026EEC70C|nr:glycosyltransferase family 1 protein [Megamonas hypermegale]
MKKIYINGRFLTQNITGVQRYAVEMVKALDRHLDTDELSSKYKFEIVCPKNIKQKIELNNIKIKQIGILKGHLWEQIELPLYAKSNFLFNFCNCAPLIKKNQVVTIHDAAVCAVPEAYSFLFRIWYKTMFYILGYRLNRIFTDSMFSKQELHKYFFIDLKKIDVIYLGVEHILKIKPDEKVFDKFQIKKNSYILAVSSLNPSKNFKLILKTAKEMPDTNFVIAGGTNSSIFKSKGLPVTDNVKFIGYVNDEELVALYKYASCFVYPSLYEGFGIPPLEAMVFNCPTIVSNIEVFKEVYSNDVIICDNNDFNLLNKIKYVKSLKKKNFYHKNVNDILIKYSWDKVGKTVLDLIRNIEYEK